MIIVSAIKSKPAGAQHAHPADRFAREIVGISTPSDAARSRRLMRNPLGGATTLLEFDYLLL